MLTPKIINTYKSKHLQSQAPTTPSTYNAKHLQHQAPKTQNTYNTNAYIDKHLQL